jgi:hypothetical protein
MDTGMDVPARAPQSVREHVLNTAKDFVTADRNADYGTPESNFGTIAEFWSSYLKTPVSPHDVAAMMLLMKVSRIMTSPSKEDNWIDAAGYAACGAEVAP